MKHERQTRVHAALSIILFSLVLCAIPSFARLPIPEGSEDLQELARSASFIFHGSVISFDTVRSQYHESGYAILKVDRWYKGKLRTAIVRLRFHFAGFGSRDGHDCIDLHRTESWLIFANQLPDGSFVFSNDCEGGLPMSPMLAANPHGSWAQQLHQDLIAGLHDPDRAVRLANIARLGGLKIRSSAALHDFISHGSDEEKKWAVYADLRSGDMSELPQAQAIVINIDDPDLSQRDPNTHLNAAPRQDAAYVKPDVDIALELQHVRDARAVPYLIRILRTAKTSLVRDCAGQALMEMKDPRSASAAAGALSDPDRYVRYVRYDALITLMYLTKAPACTRAPNTPDSELEPIIDRCRLWWRDTGSSLDWPSPE